MAAAATKSSSDQLQHPQRPPLSESMENIALAKSAFKCEEHLFSRFKEAGENSIPCLDESGQHTSLRKQSAVKMSLSKKCFFVCFMSYDSSGEAVLYSIWSVPLSVLLGDPNESPRKCEKLEFLHSWAHRYESFGRSCIALGTRLYYLGGEDRDDRNSFTPFSGYFLSHDLLYFDLCEMQNQCSCSSYSFGYMVHRLPRMQSGKAKPIVVEIGGKLYVLAGAPYNCDSIPNPSFEVFDPCDNSWSTLESPPLLVRSSKYFVGGNREHLSFVVIGNRLCVSSEHASFAYDIMENKWEACKLFDDFRPCYRGLHSSYSFRGNVLGRNPWERNADEIVCGPPFAFAGGAILYDEDILICVEPFSYPVIAYQMVDGKVFRKQELLPEIIPRTSFFSLVQLGEGYFCYTYSMDPKEDDEPNLSIVSFEVSKVGGVVKDDGAAKFLEVRVMRKLKQRIELDFFSPEYSFTF
ncbi:hypothetical protein ACH5RR_032020 [Cinchona calisaya]|uniref:Kelch repeat type 1 n=1 Tax=Cinchona calisaya TaxID=153742 RepID=A0ABD2YGW5_9GENT